MSKQDQSQTNHSHNHNCGKSKESFLQFDKWQKRENRKGIMKSVKLFYGQIQKKF